VRNSLALAVALAIAGEPASLWTAPEADAATLFNRFVLSAGQTKELYGGDLRVCNDRNSTGSARVSVRPTGTLLLAPGRCFNEWGPMTFANEGSGTVTIVTRSISKNNGRCPGHEAAHE
jgi:hypothetical protein